MSRAFLAALMSLGMVMAGCTEPSGLIGDPYADEPTPYQPEPSVGPLAVSGPGNEPAIPTWDVLTMGWSPWLPESDAVLNLTIRVENTGGGPPYFEGDGWVFRLHLKNGTVRVPADADWFRIYTLQGSPNGTTDHATSYRLGDLIAGDPYMGRGQPQRGDPIIFQLTFHKVLEDRSVRAFESTARYWPQDGGYLLDLGAKHRYVCRGTCAGVAERGWLVYPSMPSQVLPAQDAVLDLSILATDEGASEPLDGDGWRFRLSAIETLEESPFGGQSYNGTVEAPAHADWRHTYDLNDALPETCSFRDREMDCLRQPTSFVLGDLGGSSIVLRLDYHKVFNNDHWEAWYAYFYLWRAEDNRTGVETYHARIEGAARLACNSETGYGRCPWYDEYGEVPPPEDW